MIYCKYMHYLCILYRHKNYKKDMELSYKN
jgi:hypothetical protein